MTILHICIETGTVFQRKLICCHHVYFPKSSALKGQSVEEPLHYALCLIPQDSSFQIAFEILQKKAEGSAWKHH